MRIVITPVMIQNFVSLQNGVMIAVPVKIARNTEMIKLESDEYLPHTCPQCDTEDPAWQCDSCEGCESCTEQCSECMNNLCLDCCEGHD